MFSPTQHAMSRFPREGRTHKEDWFSFASEIKAVAKHATPGIDPNGLLGWILPPADYLLLSNPAPLVPFALAESAGDMPQSAAAFPSWKYRDDRCQSQQQAMSLFSQSVIRALDPVALAKARGEDLIENVAFPVVYARLVAAYAVASAMELTANHASLLLPFAPPADMAAHALRHADAHLFASRNGQPYSNAAKTLHFRASILQCGLFSTALAIWEAANPLVADQTWTSLSAAITHAAMSVTSSSAASLGYALSAPAAGPHVSSAPSWTDYNDLALEIKTLKLAALARSSGGRRSVAGSAAPGIGAVSAAGVSAVVRQNGRNGHPPTLTPNTASGGQGHFCWSHTTQGHLGIDCTNPLPGHQPTATWNNRMGSPCH